ncbi:uncharacterized protein LOC143231826 isoform X6 [Tachypleus tridentatus]|uniref:uncharacterized protein LOC143231826 isoform X6 n=1 Tax=Tachypleus tridentatus TaxID=6853 RepID=UPI003FD0099E
MLMSHLPGTIEYWASSSLYQIKIRRVFLLVIFVWKRKMSSSSFMKTRDSNERRVREYNSGDSLPSFWASTSVADG